MDTEPFRRHAHALVDWMAEYLEGVERFPVKAQVEPGEIARRLPSAPPRDGEAMERIFRDFERDLLPGVTHWQHPSFFAYFPANASPPSILAEMLTATLGLQCMMWQTSPAAAELEARVMEWLRQMLGLPDGFTGVIQDSASSATLCSILTARERATDWRANETGVGAHAPMTVYCSAETHSSIEKAVGIIGIGRANLRKVAVDGRAFAMRADALNAAIAADLAAGFKPICVVATLGTTGASGIDALRPIGEICRRHGIWLHVDAAWAGSALVLPEYRWMIDGIENVDSFVMNPHKWLLTNFDCSAHYVRDPDALVRSLAILPEFLKTRERGQVDDYRDWGVPLGRRFRARSRLLGRSGSGFRADVAGDIGALRFPLSPDRRRRRGGARPHQRDAPPPPQRCRRRLFHPDQNCRTLRHPLLDRPAHDGTPPRRGGMARDPRDGAGDLGSEVK